MLAIVRKLARRRRPRPTPPPAVIALRIALHYALGAGTWIIVSDYVTVGPLGVGHPDWYLNTWKGMLFVAVTAVLLFFMVRRSVSQLAASRRELEESYDATLMGWGRAMELRDRETEDHCVRVTELAVKVGTEIGLTPRALKDLRWGALLHDIGKLGVPDTILLKQSPLSEEEWQVMRRHPKLAYDLLQPIRHLAGAIDIPYCHHERWDGQGYPRGLKGSEIPILARIFAVVDVWDALSSARPYRESWTPDRCLAYIQKEAGAAFDPAVVDALKRVVTRQA